MYKNTALKNIYKYYFKPMFRPDDYFKQEYQEEISLKRQQLDQTVEQFQSIITSNKERLLSDIEIPKLPLDEGGLELDGMFGYIDNFCNYLFNSYSVEDILKIKAAKDLTHELLQTDYSLLDQPLT